MNATPLVRRASEAGVLIATAESCTGGLIAGAITDVPGSSAVFDRGFVTYSNAAKTEMLGVDPKTIAAEGAVSEAVACEMATGALAQSGAQISVSVTGVAGPGGTAAKPEGMVCFATATTSGVHAETRHFGAIGRDAVRKATVAHALDLLAMRL